jgi:Phage Single-stranded DNA-binding protein
MSTQEESGGKEIVRANVSNPLAPTEAGSRFWASFPAKTAEDKTMLQKVLNGQHTAISDMLGKEIAVKHVCVKTVELTNEETGEVADATRLVLIGPDDEMYACTSDYAWTTLREIMSPLLYGPPPWDPALLLVCEQHRSGRKRTFYTLTCVGTVSE